MFRARKPLRTAALCLVVVSRLLAQDRRLPASADSFALFQRGQQLALANRLAEAEVFLAKACALSPADSEVMTLLAEVKGRLGESKEAVKLLRIVVDSQPRSAEARLNLALALADAGNTSEALLRTSESIHLDPQNPRAHLNRARLLADLQRPAEARAEFLRAERLAPADPQVDYFWAVFEKGSHHPDAAAPLLAKIVDRDPGNLRALILLAETQQQLGRQRDAIAAWRRAIAVAPSSQEAVYALSQALRQTQPDEAAQLLQRFNLLHAQSQKEEHVRELGNKAYASMQQRDWQAALTTLQEAIQLNVN
jgi:tetratricopeptide (TPR) repeat protein